MKIIQTALALLVSFLSASAASRQTQWEQVNNDMAKDLPKSAIATLEAIDRDARAEQAWPEAVRATALRLRLAGGIAEGDDPIASIKALDAELPNTPPAMQPLLRTIDALWLWDYFSRNRWEFMQRTRTGAKPGDDIQTWDLARILGEVDARFQNALANRESLRAIPIGDYDFVIEKGNVPDSLYPTLYDFIVLQYLSFLEARNQVDAADEDEFTFGPASPAFDSLDGFLAWKPESADENSERLKALRLYQELLTYHRNDRDARIHNDLMRLGWAKQEVTGAMPVQRLIDRLNELIEQSAGNEQQSLVRSILARMLIGEGRLAEARDIAVAGRDAFKKSRYGDLCASIIEDIESKEVDIDTELVWNAAKPEFRVRYQNISRLWFRLYPAQWKPGRYNYRDEKALHALLAGKPAREWSVDLEPTPDFKEKTRALDAPLDIPPGYYELVVSAREKFTLKNNQISYARVCRSDLALTTRIDTRDSGGWVNQAISGEPVKDAKVEVWTYQNKKDRWTLAETLSTDAGGRFSTRSADTLGTGHLFRARLGDDSLASGQEHFNSYDSPDKTDMVYLFTDRALYRPGQTVRYKGIAASYDRQTNDYHTRNHRDFEVRFVDANEKEIAKAQLKSNEFGSFAGSFTIPQGRVLGVAGLVCEDSRQAIRIEEYKRPKFQVEVGPAKAQPKLDGPVIVTATATAYTGAAIDGAKVKWSVTRETRWPAWSRWCWWFVPNNSGSKQIAHGESVTKADGTCEITFTAEPDRNVDPAHEPVFSYLVTADVTDTAGETRSASRSVEAGYVGVKAALGADDWQETAKPVKLSVFTQTIDDEPVSVKGTVTIHRLKQPASVIRAVARSNRGYDRRPATVAAKNPGDPNSWELAEVVQKSDFTTDDNGKTEIEAKLEAGEYRAVLETADAAGMKVTALLPLRVVDPDSSRFPVRVANHFSAKSTRVKPGEEFVALWGTGYPEGRVWTEIRFRGRAVKSGWSKNNATQEVLRFPVTAEYRGGFTVYSLFIHENRTYSSIVPVDVPWDDHDLTLKFETMRSKLEPGARETWSVLVEGAKKDSVEMVATLYDASLDAFVRHPWFKSLAAGFYGDTSYVGIHPVGGKIWFYSDGMDWNPHTAFDSPDYRHLSEDISKRAFDRYMNPDIWNAPGLNGDPFGGHSGFAAFGTASSPRALLDKRSTSEEADPFSGEARPSSPLVTEIGQAAVDLEAALNQIAARKNLQETAFFEPQLTTDEHGIVKMTFTMPDALTRWRFMGFAHDAALCSGYLEGEAVTAKDLMVQPNPPRFLREGDEIEFTVKITNQATQPQSGEARLTFADAATLDSRDAALALANTTQPFNLPAKESKTLSWRIKVPDGSGFLIYKAVAAAGKLTDGEEGIIPVLSRRQLVTEAMTMPIRNAGAREFEMKKLVDSGASNSLRSEKLAVEVASQPAWYAVMALPYLMEYPYECAEQTFNRLYANQLAAHIANSDPKIRNMFGIWRNTPGVLESTLLKNQDLKSLLIEETPWLRDANNETESRRNTGVLFDENRLVAETARATKRLADMQLDSGALPWFPGGRGDEYITLYVVTGAGRLRHLGVKADDSLALRALDWLDGRIRKQYEDIAAKDRKDDHFSPDIAMYLYGRSFYLDQRPIAAKNRKAVDYFLSQGAKYWMNQDALMTRCHTALGLLRFGDKETPAAIVKSLRENALNTDELGMHWRLNKGYYWNQAPIETQAMIIETFREVAHDMKSVDDCQVWLLKQKQTQGWQTTKSTADAIYALLLGGDAKRLASGDLVRVELGGVPVEPADVEPGTGFYERVFQGPAIKPDMGKVKLVKTDPGVSWASLSWQYLEDISKITPFEGTPLEVKKSLWVKRTTTAGATLEPVAGPLHPGDEVVTRIEIRADRDMEYIHLKSQRGSGVEPANVLSQYKWQDGLGYYEMTKDTADHFFIDRLPRGTYVFETSAFVQLRGTYPTGIAEIQCMYAPEFNSHSGSVMMKVD